MEQPQIRRIYRQLTPEEHERWLKARAEVEQEMPELIARHKLLIEAANDPTVSGIVRRAVHRTGLMLPHVASAAGLTVDQVHEFLRGERILRSDVLDRLGKAAGLEFPPELDEPKKPVVRSVVPPISTSVFPMTSVPTSATGS